MNVFLKFVIYCFLSIMFFSHETLGQVVRNRYSGILRENERNQQFPNDYSMRRVYNDRYNTLDSLHSPKVGFNSIYSDSRCLKNRDPQSFESPPVSVYLRLGRVVGTYVYLCDGPLFNELERPQNMLNQMPKIYKNITIFLGIPYALPPTKDLRFRPPQVHPSFSSISALEYHSACPQLPKYMGVKSGITSTQEDCLYLNVFSPSVIPQPNKYAVMIYIHGGDWDHGSSNAFPAQMLAASQEVVVITFNYRLGPLGFFATGENSSAGNYGLLDQAMAIEWVYDNIDAFNGDSKRITLFGPGVGAASAGIHAFSRRLGKKIHRVIAQSGAAVADWAVIQNNYTVVNNSQEYASFANCQFQSLWRTAHCLRQAPLNFFESTDFQSKVGWYPWCPVIDVCSRDETRQVLPDSPENMIKYHYGNLHKDFAYLSGVTKDEAISMLSEDPDFKRSKIITKEKLQKEIHKFSLIFNFTLDVTALQKALEFMYFPKDKDSENATLLQENLVNMLSDSYFKAPNDKMIKLLLERNVRTYMYVLNQTLEGLITTRDIYERSIEDVVPHDSEYYMVTGAPFMDPKLYPSHLNLQQAKWTEGDRNLSLLLMTTWANFAKFGNPTPVPLFESIMWEPVDQKNMKYLFINTTNFTSVMMSGYRQKESQFWNYFLPTLMKLDFIPSTYCRPLYEPWEDKKHIFEASLWSVLAAICLSFTLCIICICLYCRAKSKHMVSIEDIPDGVSSVPSSIDTLLHMKRMEPKKYLAERLKTDQRHTQV